MGGALQYSEVNLSDVQAAVKKLMPKRSQSSKYEKEHIIGLKADVLLERVSKMNIEARSLLAHRKGVQYTQNSLDISDNLRHNAGIGAHLASIARNDDALSDDVKPTKITLTSHTINAGSEFAILSAIHGEQRATPEQVVNRLMEQLPQGHYHNKLTIALKACNTGKSSEGGESTIDIIASILRENGYYGIKVTGPNEEILAIHSGNSELEPGNYAFRRGETLVKTNHIDAKKVTNTGDDPHVTPSSP